MQNTIESNSIDGHGEAQGIDFTTFVFIVEKKKEKIILIIFFPPS